MTASTLATSLPSASKDASSSVPAANAAPVLDDQLDGFLVEALRSQKDRNFVLKIEHTVLLFLADPEYQNSSHASPFLMIPCSLFLFVCRPLELEFPPMNSFYRMLAHHVAAYYNLGHFVEPHSKQLVVQKNPTAKLPSLRLVDLIAPTDQMAMMQALSSSQQSEISSRATVSDGKESASAVLADKIADLTISASSSEEKPLSSSSPPQVVISGDSPPLALGEKKSFNPEAAPFVPTTSNDNHGSSASGFESNFYAARSNNRRQSTTTSSPAAASNAGMFSPRIPGSKVINIIDPSQARPPEHILVLADVTNDRLQTLTERFPMAVFRARPSTPTIGYVIFPSAELARAALRASNSPTTTNGNGGGASPIGMRRASSPHLISPSGSSSSIPRSPLSASPTTASAASTGEDLKFFPWRPRIVD